MTPEEFHTKQRTRELERLLTSEEQLIDHRLTQEKEKLAEIRRRNDEEAELERLRHNQNLALMQQQLTQMEEQFQQQLRQQQLAYDQLIRAMSFQHAAVQATELKNVLGVDDAEMSTILPATIGEQSVLEMTHALNAQRERQAALARENTQLKYDLEATRIKADAEVHVAGIKRGLADHRNIDFVASEFRSMTRPPERAAALSLFSALGDDRWAARTWLSMAALHRRQ